MTPHRLHAVLHLLYPFCPHQIQHHLLGQLALSLVEIADMISVFEELHRYVPVVTSAFQYHVLIEGEIDECTNTKFNDKFHRLLVGGDQLTAARARGAQ